MFRDSVVVTAKNVSLTFVAAALLAGCGGAGGGAGLYAAPQPIGSPQAVPTPAPGSALATLSLKGALGFINPVGRTVYIFDADLMSPGHSVCNGACAQNWPPVSPAGKIVMSPFSAITRDDGSQQLAYAGRPLYTFVADSAEGQTNGDGVNAFGGLWHIARPNH